MAPSLRPCHKKAVFIALFMISSCLLFPPSQAISALKEPGLKAQKGPWTVNATKLIFYHSTHTVVGKGSVVVKGESIEIHGDYLALNWVTGEARARGGVLIKLDGDLIAGDSGTFNIKTGIGHLVDARLFIKRNELHLEAKDLVKTGVQEYQAKDAVITTCSPPKPPWSFKCRRLVLDESGMVKAWGTRFRVKNLPILYSPWVAVPLNKYRKSGVLIPSLSGSKRNGFGINVPIYLVLSDSIDATFYQNPMADRGWMEGVELRYILSQGSKGVFRYNFLIDTKTDNDFNNDGFSRENEKRWWLRAKGDQELPLGFNGLYDIDLISDLDYLQEFDYGPMGFDKTDKVFEDFFQRHIVDDTDLIRPSYLQAQKEWEDGFIGAQAVYNDNQIPHAQDSTVQTLPYLHVKGLQTRISSAPFPLFLGYDVSYVNYWREEGLREQRVFLSPTLYSPIQISGPVDLLAKASMDDRFYRVEGGGYTTKNKTNVRFELDASSTFERLFSAHQGLIKHTIRPKLIYSYRPYQDERDLPDIDATDKLGAQNRITLEILSFLTRKDKGQGVASFHDILRFKLAQSYEMEGKSLLPHVKDQGHHFSDTYTELELYLGDLFVRYDSTYNWYGDGFTTYNLWAHGHYSRLSAIDLIYRYGKLTSVNELNMSLEGQVLPSLYARYELKKTFEEEKDFESRYALRYQSRCWALETGIHRDRDETRITFEIQLLGLGGWSYGD